MTTTFTIKDLYRPNNNTLVTVTHDLLPVIDNDCIYIKTDDDLNKLHAAFWTDRFHLGVRVWHINLAHVVSVKFTYPKCESLPLTTYL